VGWSEGQRASLPSHSDPEVLADLFVALSFSIHIYLSAPRSHTVLPLSPSPVCPSLFIFIFLPFLVTPSCLSLQVLFVLSEFFCHSDVRIRFRPTMFLLVNDGREGMCLWGVSGGKAG
jgi:hypothetical protein